MSKYIDILNRQQRYIAEQKKKGSGAGLVFADAFLRGIRDIGYKSNSWALAEIIDNSIQAGAKTVAIQFGFDNGNESQIKPDSIAIIDDGIGMHAEMIGYAVRWGGTDRENDRSGLGRYGYGLPCAAVSMCTKYTVYSKLKGQDWHAVTIDIEEVAKVANNPEGMQKLLTPRSKTPPLWLSSSMNQIDVVGMESGTVVVLEQLDRIDCKKVVTLKSKLLEDIGVIYRHYLPSPKILVQGTVVEPADPLFLMESGRHFAETEVMAIRVETKSIDVSTSRGTTGSIRIRASYLPLGFADTIPAVKGKTNKRFDLMKNYNGILVCRAGRQIDCVRPKWTVFQNNDRYIKIELDFDPELDEFFGVTTSKQQIRIDDYIWDKVGAVKAVIADMRKRFNREKDKARAREEAGDPAMPRPSEEAVRATDKFKQRRIILSEAKERAAEERLERAATKIARQKSRPQTEVKNELTKAAETRPYRVEFAAIPEGPFYRPERLGTQRVITINTAHPFYEKVFMRSSEVRDALEVLLLILGDDELDSDGDRETFYRSARNAWSERYRVALDQLESDEALRDRLSAESEALESEGALNSRN